MYQFTDDCLTGIEEIDKEHQHLFELIGETNQLLLSDSDIRVTAMNLLKELKEYTQTHFAHEEAYMEKIQDPELSRQRSAHQAFVARVETFNIVNLSDENLRTALSDLLEYLSRWLFQHILGSDIFIGKFKSPFAFTEEYLVGVELIDEEHRKLFSIIERANDLIHEEHLHDKYDEIIEILEELKDYTIFHFEDEEHYMREINYSGLDAQIHAHESFVDKLNEVDLDDVDENQEEYLNNLIAFLLSWLVNHILKMDKLIH